MQQPMSDSMHTLNVDATNNIQHTSFHTSATKQVHMPMNNYQGQTGMVNSANFYEASHASNCYNIQQGVSSFYSLAANPQYVVPPQHVNSMKVAYVNSAPYANANNHDLAPNVPSNYSRINEISASKNLLPHAQNSVAIVKSGYSVLEKKRFCG